MKRPPFAWRVMAHAVVPLVPWALRKPADRAAHRERLASPVALGEWAARHRDPSRPLAWFHAPSVGEGEQARIVMAELLCRRPDLQIVFTHFSPSADQFAARVGADWHGYLPYDLVRPVTQALDAVRPDLLVFARADLWPEFAMQAAARRTAVAMIAATVSPESSRLGWPTRMLTRSAYRAIDLAIATGSGDATRLEQLGVQPDRIVIDGDPRVDAVLDRLHAAKPGAVPASVERLLPTDPRHTLIAGSTWPEDERLLLRAFVRVRTLHPTATLVVVPHQPDPQHLAWLDARAHHHRLPSPQRLSRGIDRAAHLIVVDSLGLLAKLYAEGFAAYVGGGFGITGIHSIIEPAALRKAVIIGPHDRGNREAALMAQGGGLLQLGAPGKQTVAQLARIWTEWLTDAARASAAGEAAWNAIALEHGAARRTAERLAALLDERSGLAGSTSP